ncbi:MAG: polysaccharide deacetylase family protein [Betaproteobacteria bacterium]|nr:polysaccharide deacetylase family protein [Betaproteobacteria bacterium]
MARRLLFLFLCLSLAATAAAEPPHAVAITFDDLPYAAVPSEDDAQLEAMTERLLHGLQSEQVPAVGFVNEAKLYREGTLDPKRVGLLRRWLAAGFELGNHTYSHLSLDRSGLDAFEADLLQGEIVTRLLMQSTGKTLRWFRHPFLHRGTTPEVRRQFQAFLAAHGYTVAPVTVNGGEWIFAAAYAHALSEGDEDAARRIGAAYVPYMQAVLAQAEQLALDLFGRPISQVMVLHANTLNADHFAALAAMLKQRGYRFISLDDALRDSAYASPLGSSTLEGESWLQGWAREAGLRPPAEPPIPGFVTQWAGTASLKGY